VLLGMFALPTLRHRLHEWRDHRGDTVVPVAS